MRLSRNSLPWATTACQMWVSTITPCKEFFITARNMILSNLSKLAKFLNGLFNLPSLNYAENLPHVNNFMQIMSSWIIGATCCLLNKKNWWLCNSSSKPVKDFGKRFWSKSLALKVLLLGSWHHFREKGLLESCGFYIWNGR